MNKINLSSYLHRLKVVWNELSHSQKALFMTCVIMFFNLILSMVLHFEKRIITHSTEEVFVEFSLEKKNIIEEVDEQKKIQKKRDITFVDIQLQTHQAFDENRDITDNLEELEDEVLEEELKLKELKTEDFLVQRNSKKIENLLYKSKEVLDDSKNVLAQIGNKKKSSSGKANNSRTTVSFDLQGRKALDIRTPAYTCEMGGIMVVDIVVSKSGLVISANINKDASSNKDGCLEKNAIEYAQNAVFAPSEDNKKQRGTITFMYID